MNNAVPGRMTLHWSPRSPYVRKVMIAAHEMGLQDRLRPVRTVVGGTTPHRELMRINPLGKIPTLELEDGTILYDSPVICEYLDTLHDGPKLFPAAWPARGVALRRLALVDPHAARLPLARRVAAAAVDRRVARQQLHLARHRDAAARSGPAELNRGSPS